MMDPIVSFPATPFILHGFIEAQRQAAAAPGTEHTEGSWVLAALTLGLLGHSQIWCQSPPIRRIPAFSRCRCRMGLGINCLSSCARKPVPSAGVDDGWGGATSAPCMNTCPALRPSSWEHSPRQDTIVYLPPFPWILPSLEMVMLETFF